MKSERFIELLEQRCERVVPYSGRGMYGFECVSVKLTNDNPYGIVASVMFGAEDDSERSELVQIFERTAEDGLGLGMVIYWPRMEWPKEK